MSWQEDINALDKKTLDELKRAFDNIKKKNKEKILEEEEELIKNLKISDEEDN